MDHWRYYIHGCLLELFGYKQQAIAAYRAATQAAPGFLRPTNRIAYLLASQERFAEAEPYFQAVLRANPGNAVAHFNLGYTLDKRGQYEQARSTSSAKPRGSIPRSTAPGTAWASRTPSSASTAKPPRRWSRRRRCNP